MAKKSKQEGKVKTKKKGMGKRIGLAFLGCIFVLVALFGIGALINYVSSESNIEYAKSMQAVAKEDALEAPVIDEETGYWTFTTDREFKILQLTDVHIGGGFLSIQKDNWAMTAIADMITKHKPDLVVVTGDIAYPVPFQAGTFNNMTPIKEFTALMESLQVYWTFTYGNHDTEVYSYYDRADIDKYYNEHIANGDLKYCLYQSGFHGENIEGYEGIEANAGFGNTMILVKNTAGEITQSVIMLDSHAYEQGFFQDYDHIHECQIDWYEGEINKLTALNDGTVVKSLAFFHIPLAEYKDAYMEWYDNGKKNTDNVDMKFGIMGEDPNGEWIYCGVSPDGMFEKMLELGSTQGIFCGHDHYNNFSLMYNGGEGDKYIRLTYGLSIDYLAYFGIAKETAQRGCTIIEVGTDGNFDCYGYQLSTDKIIE